jgi:hypothetical protein
MRHAASSWLRAEEVVEGERLRREKTADAALVVTARPRGSADSLSGSASSAVGLVSADSSPFKRVLV